MKRNILINAIIGLLASATITVLCLKVEKVEKERDLLSDAIRSWDDQDDKEDLSIMQSVDYFLEEIGEDHTILGEWVYCY